MTQHDSPSKLAAGVQAIRSSGVVFDMISSSIIKPSTSVSRVSEKDMKDFNQMKLLSSISPLSTFLDKKNRRKTVIRPTSCEMFWENEGLNDDLAPTPTTATTSGSALTTPAAILTQSSTPIRPDLTPWDQVMNRGTRLAGKQCLRPNMSRFGSLPNSAIPKRPTPTIDGVTNSLPGGSRPSMILMGRRTTVAEVEIVKRYPFEIPGPNDTVRFGNALNRALILHLSRLCDIGTDEAESNSYWSASE
ncbi:uncharacterized protein MELLADRAFT_62883 [Melampsora larici-populina 98AG31]|uniref:Uncharacterized protein n=1 Tax=Melampsora larici-populina (strain 98AG31 / pathotype 3-4-7) TaxID=747676 RepID=F4RKL4_MELLP|nr:uncharacterized protein MELLADRAFT_62883 [Melampsora larici-populina 98AG31]EGG07157.1 hypothetical protein MELLADRAFT_62883 [Melampsora larici-populina 98AG31]